MKKTLLLTLTLLVLLLILTSCQVSNTDNNSSTDKTTPMHTVTFSLNDEGDGDFTASIERGTGIPRPQDPVRDGYTFDGWYVGDEKWSFITHTVNNDITLYAKWEPVTYQIEYVGAQGTITTYTINDEFELPNGIVGQNDTFLGWYLDSELTKKVTKIEKGTIGNLTLYAKTEIETPEFVFAKNNDSYNTYTLISCKSNQTTVTIPQLYSSGRVTRIGPYAFYGCKELVHVELPSSVIEISEYAFANCEALTSINTKNITLIGNYAFSKCYALTDIELNPNLISIGNGAFEFCTGLESVEIPIYAKSVGYGAFNSTKADFKVYTRCELAEKPEWIIDSAIIIWGYTGKKGTTNSGYEWAETTKGAVITGYTGESTELEIPRSINGSKVVGICSNAFKGRITLTGVVIPSTIEEIGNNAFSATPSLKIYCELAEKPEGWSTSWARSTGVIVWEYMGGKGINENGYEWAKIKNGVVITGYNGPATALEIPAMILGSEVIAIANHAFYYRIALTSVTIPNTITTIGEKAFYGCNTLESVTMGENVKSIGAYAFYYCISLKEIDLGTSVESIGSYAFAYCEALKIIKLNNNVTEIGERAFASCKNLHIYCEATEKPEGWDENWNGSICNAHWDYLAPDTIE